MGRPIEGAQLTFDKDTRWDVSIKVAENSMSTGLIIEGSGDEFEIPNIFLGYSEGAWKIGYGFNGSYSFFNTIQGVEGLEARFQLIVSSNGTKMQLFHDSNWVFSRIFDSPIFGIGTQVTTYTLCGPQSSLEISSLSISINENQPSYETVAQSAPDYPTTPAPVIPAVSGPITVANANRLTRLVSLGEGDLINVQLSPDGKYVVVGSSTGLLVLDATTLERENFLQSTMKPEEIYFFDDGTKIAALDRYHERGHVWTFPEGEEVREVKMACNLDPTGIDRWYYSWPSKNLEFTFAYITNSAGLCQSGDGVPVYTLDYQMNGYPAFSMDERLLAIPTADKVVLLQYHDGKVLAEIPVVGIKGIFFTPDGTALAGVFDNQTRFWSTTDYQLIDTLNGIVSKPIYSPDHTVFAAQNGDTYRLIRSSDREYINSVKGTNLQFTDDSKGMIVDSGSGQVSYYSIDIEQKSMDLVNSLPGEGIRRGADLSSGFISDNKNNLLVAKPEESVGSWLTELRVYDIKSGERSSYDVIKHLGWGFSFEDAVWLENLNQFAVILGSSFEYYRFFTLDPSTGSFTQVIEDIQDAKQANIKFTTPNDLLVFSRGETVTIWDIIYNTYGNPKVGINGYANFFAGTNRVASPNGRYYISISEEQNPGYRKFIRVSINGEMVQSYTGFSDLDYAFSPDSTMLAISTFSMLRGINISVFDLETEERLFFSGDYFAEGDMAPKVAFSPDGNFLAILPETGYPQIWGIP